jgi:hypothetical protein
VLSSRTDSTIRTRRCGKSIISATTLMISIQKTSDLMSKPPFVDPQASFVHARSSVLSKLPTTLTPSQPDRSLPQAELDR